MDPNTINCIIALGVVILIIVLVRVIQVARKGREKSANVKRMEARQDWTDGFQDRKREKDDDDEQDQA
jgi:hypothetical protein